MRGWSRIGTILGTVISPRPARVIRLPALRFGIASMPIHLATPLKAVAVSSPIVNL
jgi:hypothetical protein